MAKNIVIIVLSFFLIISNGLWMSGYNSSYKKIEANTDIEVRVRENAIKDLSEIVLNQNKDKTINELLIILSENLDPQYLEKDKNFIFFKSIKLEYRDKKLEEVYW